MEKIPVVMCIDVEPDKVLIDIDAKEDWKGFEQSFEFFNCLRPRFQAATGRPVRYSWFLRMDPQIALGYGAADWVVKRYASLIDELARAGDVFGVHVHSWQWQEKSRSWAVEVGDQRWIDHCVKLGFESFRASLNQNCKYFRFGDLYTNNATQALAEELGAQVDLTPEPGQRGQRFGQSLTPVVFDTSTMPRSSYHPSRRDFRESDPTRRLWIMPLTTGSVDWVPEKFQSTASEWSREQDRGYRRRIADRLARIGETLEGRLERADGDFIAGWVYDPRRPNEPIEVEIYADSVLLATVSAATFRPDLLADGKGNGKHSFTVGVPSCLRDGEPHSISARVKGTSYHLVKSPLVLTSAPTEPKEMTVNLSFDTWSLCRIIDNTLRESDPYLCMVVRTDVITQRDQRSNMEQTFEYLLSHVLIDRMAFSTPTEALALLYEE